MARLTMKDKRINWNVARHEKVQKTMQQATVARARTAEVILEAHRHDGHSRIEVDAGKVDWFVSLSDERGQMAALSIEFGREPGQWFDDETGELRSDRGMVGIAPLREAFDLL